MACSAACKVETQFRHPRRGDAPASRQRYASRADIINRTWVIHLDSTIIELPCNTTTFPVHQITVWTPERRYSIWRPTFGPHLPLPLRLPLRHHPPCPNPPPHHASRHNFASTRPHYEVCPPHCLCASSLTNHKLVDRFSPHLTRHNRRFDHTKLKCTAHACTTGS